MAMKRMKIPTNKKDQAKRNQIMTGGLAKTKNSHTFPRTLLRETTRQLLPAAKSA
jgi:hypothetical protein